MTKFSTSFQPATQKLGDFVDAETHAKMLEIAKANEAAAQPPAQAEAPARQGRSGTPVDGDVLISQNATVSARHAWLAKAAPNMTVGQFRAAASQGAGETLSMSDAARLPKASLAQILGPFLTGLDPAVSAAIQGSYQGFSVSKGSPMPSMYDLPEAPPATPKAIDQKLPEGWTGRVATFELGELPAYEADTRQALDLAYAWDKAGKPEVALGVYDQVLGLDPENPDALNRKALAEKHAATALVAKTAKNNESPNVRRDAIRGLESAIAGFEKVVQQGVDFGLYNPATNTLGFSNPDKLMGDANRQGTLHAVPKALYNLAVSKLQLAELKGAQPLADDGVLAAFSRAANVRSSLSGDAAQSMVRRSTWSGDDAYTKNRNTQMSRFVASAAGFLEGTADRLRSAFKQDGDLRAFASTPALQNAVDKPGIWG